MDKQVFASDGTEWAGGSQGVLNQARVNKFKAKALNVRFSLPSEAKTFTRDPHQRNT